MASWWARSELGLADLDARWLLRLLREAALDLLEDWRRSWSLELLTLLADLLEGRRLRLASLEGGHRHLLWLLGKEGLGLRLRHKERLRLGRLLLEEAHLLLALRLGGRDSLEFGLLLEVRDEL